MAADPRLNEPFASSELHRRYMYSEPQSGFSKALALSLKLISSRDRSEFQIRSALVSANIEETDILAVLDRLRSQQILNDDRLAKRLVQSRNAKGIGLERIRNQLLTMGIEEVIVDAAVHDLYEHQPELIVETLRKRLARSPNMARGKAARFLVGKGFIEEDVDQAINLVFGDKDDFTE